MKQFKNLSSLDRLILFLVIVKALVVIGLVVLGFYLWQNRAEILSMFFSAAVPDNVVTRPYNEYCEKDYILKEMVVYDHLTQQTRPILIGSQELVNKALLVSKEPKPLHYICTY